MKIAMQTILTDQHGQPFSSSRSNQIDGPVLMTLWELCENGLLAGAEVSVEEMESRVVLSQKIHEAKEPIALTKEETEKIKTLLSRVCKLPWVITQARKLLTPQGG